MSRHVTPKSVLTPKQRGMTVQAQVQSCIRIARRAEAKADHIESLMQQHAYGYHTEARRSEGRREVAALRDKCSRACDEVIRIVQDSPDAGWTREQRAYCASQEVER